MTRSTICESIFLHSPTIPLSNSSFLSFIFSQSSRFGCCADERLLTSKLSSPVFETLSSSSPLNTLTLLHWINYSTSILLLQPFLWTRYYLATRSNLVLDLLRFGLTAIVTNRAARLAVLKDVSVGKRTPNDCVFALPGFCYIVLFITFTTKRRLRIGKILFPGRQKPKALWSSISSLLRKPSRPLEVPSFSADVSSTCTLKNQLSFATLHVLLILLLLSFPSQQWSSTI